MAQYAPTRQALYSTSRRTVVCARRDMRLYSEPMKLKDYIAAMGDKAFAEFVGVSRRIATDWRNETRIPRPKAARHIVEKTGGKVSMADIYGATTK